MLVRSHFTGKEFGVREVSCPNNQTNKWNDANPLTRDQQCRRR